MEACLMGTFATVLGWCKWLASAKHHYRMVPWVSYFGLMVNGWNLLPQQDHSRKRCPGNGHSKHAIRHVVEAMWSEAPAGRPVPVIDLPSHWQLAGGCCPWAISIPPPSGKAFLDDEERQGGDETRQRKGELLVYSDLGEGTEGSRGCCQILSSSHGWKPFLVELLNLCQWFHRFE